MFHQVAYRTREPWAHLDEQREAHGRTCAHTQSPANMWESYITALSYSFHLPNLALGGESEVHPCLCIDFSALGLPLLLLLSGAKEDSGLTCDLFLQVHWPLSLESSRSHFLLRDLPLPFSSWQRTDCSCQFSETTVFWRCKKSDCVFGTSFRKPWGSSDEISQSEGFGGSGRGQLFDPISDPTTDSFKQGLSDAALAQWAVWNWRSHLLSVS